MKDIIFIHGMFLTAKSWKPWEKFFGARGYNCRSLFWPLHEDEPAILRSNPPANLGDLHLDEVVASMTHEILKHDKPVVIGHSVGGLIAQLLANKDLVSLAVTISSVAPNAMLEFDWNFIKNSALITNPLKGNKPFVMDETSFHQFFANTLDKSTSDIAWEDYAVYDSRNILRDCMGPVGQVDLNKPHIPLLFIIGEEDKIIPVALAQKNARAYTDSESIVNFKSFPQRSHFICGEPGWEEVADYVYTWIKGQQTEPSVKLI
ncbi:MULTISPECIES: alpha/beta hydrolase [Olivibacter]|jgi:pimeloyl-ACP methyl ester carboxylesterase|uniref:Alpha/beta hydrolase n=1 Tax=Olivibacter oleidegradans TaxID=760123 RepID=A0ABV6HKK8_9SPHI|nr:MULTISPECIES: alpha/beta hydrolase [Olivibacter]MCL4638940.1 alpha/beta hydrolase [Olivibacter sp. UJ_SKK_5.1]MDM8175469.1 alpha/beta hydrolase [Olivibacter sp. 47]QEL02224.1 alpha/beta hydrolase [Olivibacter sp. LS-1]